MSNKNLLKYLKSDTTSQERNLLKIFLRFFKESFNFFDIYISKRENKIFVYHF